MIYITTAMYAEAHPFITRFQLKKEISHTHFQVFLDKEASLCLVISGTGSVAAAAAVSSICTEYGAGRDDFLLNVGVCARLRNTDIHRTENSCRTAGIFLCNKIMEQSTGKTFYPDILYRHNFTEAQIMTGAKIYTTRSRNDLISQCAENICLYDLEASAVYQAGAYYLGPHQMSFIKIISDDGNIKDVTPGQIETLICQNMDDISDYITVLLAISLNDHKKIPADDTVHAELEKLCLDLHCSRTMSESLRQHIRYCILSGVDYLSVLEEMYRNGKLPCKNKREGKQCFEELRKRLL